MQTNQIMNLIGTRCLCLLRPQQVFCQQNMKYVVYNTKIAIFNWYLATQVLRKVHKGQRECQLFKDGLFSKISWSFLDIISNHCSPQQREHLKELRRKIIKERTLIKEKLNELDEQIKTIQKKNYDRKNKSPDSYSQYDQKETFLTQR